MFVKAATPAYPERETISIPKCVVTRVLRPVDSDNFSLLP